ncbi:MAG: glycine cleavage system protein GcvH [Leptospiraceae bacterium]|nr:glycine cleavage system protein GcvH [Leptospiraceae bacterium]MCP5498961.1 glycine cleavage system protein GcvH [Leptospiraceae bacterium]
MAEAKVQDGLLYTEKHEWVKVEGDTATVGISDYAQSALGDIVFIELPEAGTELSSGDSFGTIESVKAADDLYSPVGGKVSESNSSIIEDPAAINKDAYASWMIKISGIDSSSLNSLMDANKYKEYLSSL